MNFSLLQSALRELRHLAGLGRTWAVLLGMGLVAGLVGPFGTFDMPLAARLAYWLAVVVGTAAMGILATGMIERLIGPSMAKLPAAGTAGAIAGLPIALVVVVINLFAFGPEMRAIDVVTLIAYCVPIAAAVTLIVELVRPMEQGAERTPALLARLPRQQRGRLIHLEATDHYVAVTTDKGRSLLLMRLSDAMREVEPTPGLQVHRSHWVALEAVRGSEKRSGKPELELETGTRVPVSRGYLPAVRAAGFSL